ncbi:MAG: flagellar M-ring protein FliF, partial [Spirochaetia bacterium]|nr:flagellar M-ring protein FliF [Spirochaetia bacterium]
AFWATRPDYRVLYSGLAAEDAGAVTAKLQTQGVPFKLTASGTTILAPAEQVQQLRLDLAMEGLPSKGAKGFELFDESPLGMTPFMQHVNYTRALQAELARSILRLDAVAHVRVHIVQPESSPFIREQKPTTASVVLWLKPGASLSRNAVNGIVRLVASAVEGLSPEQVTLLDNGGRILSENRNGEGNLHGSQAEYRRELETDLATKAEEMLARLLGPGRAIVRVTADVNFKRLKEKRETYNPEDRVVHTEKVTTSKNSPGNNVARGIAGASSNLGKGQAATANPSQGPTNSEETVENEYLVSKTVQESEDGVGNIERLTVAAMVDLSSPEGNDSGPALTLKETEEIIKQAVGFKMGRDEIKVTDSKLAGAIAPTAADGDLIQLQRWETYLSLARNASLGIVALITVIIGVLMLRRSRSWLSVRNAASVASTSPNEIPKDELSETTESDPELVAKVLRAWLEAEAPVSERIAA